MMKCGSTSFGLGKGKYIQAKAKVKGSQPKTKKKRQGSKGLTKGKTFKSE